MTFPLPRFGRPSVSDRRNLQSELWIATFEWRKKVGHWLRGKGGPGGTFFFSPGFPGLDAPSVLIHVLRSGSLWPVPLAIFQPQSETQIHHRRQDRRCCCLTRPKHKIGHDKRTLGWIEKPTSKGESDGVGYFGM